MLRCSAAVPSTAPTAGISPVKVVSVLLTVPFPALLFLFLLFLFLDCVLSVVLVAALPLGVVSGAGDAILCY
jgi:hypothetical protein